MDHRYGETSPRIAPGYRQQAATALGLLRRAGWTEQDLVNRLNAREWGTAGSLGRVLLKRLEDVAQEPVPKTAAQRKAERDAAGQVSDCDHGTPGGCSACFICRRAMPDDDGVICGQCAQIPARSSPR